MRPLLILAFLITATVSADTELAGHSSAVSYAAGLLQPRKRLRAWQQARQDALIDATAKAQEICWQNGGKPGAISANKVRCTGRIFEYFHYLYECAATVKLSCKPYISALILTDPLEKANALIDQVVEILKVPHPSRNFEDQLDRSCRQLVRRGLSEEFLSCVRLAQSLHTPSLSPDVHHRSSAVARYCFLAAMNHAAEPFLERLQHSRAPLSEGTHESAIEIVWNQLQKERQCESAFAGGHSVSR